MNTFNSFIENFSNPKEKFDNMDAYQKSSMFIGIISGAILLYLVFAKVMQTYQYQLPGHDKLTQTIHTFGANKFVSLIAVLLIITGSINFGSS
jgi:hypothetical protein